MANLRFNSFTDTFLTGKKGSGKSYAMANEIYHILEENKKLNNFDKVTIYTNLEGVNFNEYLKPIEWSKFYGVWEYEIKLNEIYQNRTSKKKRNPNKKDYDSVIKWLFEKKGFINPYFMIDEFHNAPFNFDIANNVNLRMLTYFRHFGHRMLFATQNLALINIKYRKQCETFYQALSSSQRLSKNNFEYALFTDYRLKFSGAGSSFVDRYNLKFDKKIADVYSSGGTQKGSNVEFLKHLKSGIKSFLFAFFILFLVYFFGYRNLMKDLDNNDKKANEQNKTIENNQTVQQFTPQTLPVGYPVPQNYNYQNNQNPNFPPMPQNQYQNNQVPQNPNYQEIFNKVKPVPPQTGNLFFNENFVFCEMSSLYIDGNFLGFTLKGSKISIFTKKSLKEMNIKIIDKSNNSIFVFIPESIYKNIMISNNEVVSSTEAPSNENNPINSFTSK